MQVRRDGKVQQIDVKSGTRPSAAILAKNELPSGQPGGAQQDIPRVLGMRLQPRTEGGLKIQGIAGDSDASDKGLRSGDVILRAGDKHTNAVGDLAAAVTEAKQAGRENVLLMVNHAGRTVFVPVKVVQVTDKDADKANG